LVGIAQSYEKIAKWVEERTRELIEDNGACLIVKDSAGQKLAFVY
jgi:serine protease inhibitor